MVDALFKEHMQAHRSEAGTVLSPAPPPPHRNITDPAPQTDETIGDQVAGPQPARRTSQTGENSASNPAGSPIASGQSDEITTTAPRSGTETLNAHGDRDKAGRSTETHDLQDRIGNATLVRHSDSSLNETCTGTNAGDIAQRSESNRPARAFLAKTATPDGDASRLMDAADTQFDEPEGNRRRNAIAHLRAAVAATRADRRLSERQDHTQISYREDLADAVGPRNPRMSNDRHAEQIPEQPAPPQGQTPLTLFEEQRVPSPAFARTPTTAVRARPTTRPVVEMPDPELAGDFANYAEKVKAHSLSDLIEAAAAYLCHVAGMGAFSRPELMGMIALAEQETSSREDRLRSLAHLLRDEKIERRPDGKFTTTGRTGFKPARATA